MAKKFLTLNIGAANVELAEYEASAKGALTLLNYGTARLAASLDGGDVETILSSALQEIMQSSGIRPGRVAISISGQLVFPRLAAIPMAGGAEKFEQLVRYEIEQNVPFPIDEMVCDRQVVGDTPDGDKSVLIVAAKVDQVEAITGALAAAGFAAELVDVAPLAVTNALNRASGGEGCSILLDIGAKTTSLVIVEGDKLYNRSIPVAGNAITKDIAAALGCSQEEAEQFKRERGYVSMGGVTEDDDETTERIAKVCRAVLTRLNAEISRSINFYRSQQGGGAPTTMYLTGGTALLPQIDVFFAESLGIEVAFFNPFETIAVSPKLDAAALEADGALLAATAGLALHQAGVARYAVNLLPPSLVEARAEKAKIPFIVTAGLALVSALVLLMLGINRQTTVITAQRDAVEGKVQQLESFDKKVKAATETFEAVVVEAKAVGQRLEQRSLAVRRLNAVRNALFQGMWIEKWEADRISVRYWKDRFEKKSDGAKASGEKAKTIGEQVVERLKGESIVDRDSVKISDMSAIGKDGQVEQVTILLKFK